MSFFKSSNSHANSVTILGHLTTGMGEKTSTFTFKRIMENAGIVVKSTLDTLELMGENFEPFAKINYDLADTNLSLMEDLGKVPHIPSSDLLLILSWNFSLAALFGTGIHKTRPTVAKLYTHHRNERLLPKLYEPADLLITESLLANERALAYGIDPGKVLFIPNSYPKECEEIGPSKRYVHKLAQQQGKDLREKTKIIGCVSRFEYGKNCEFAVEAVRRLVEKGHDVVLVLKGDFPQESLYPEYQSLFSEMLATYKDEPWLLWDRNPTLFPAVLQEYASFDMLLHPSGAEGGSQVIVECLGLLKPVVLLDCSTNPYLFKDVATFVKTKGKIRPALLPFYHPDLDDLVKTLEKSLPVPSKALVETRFHEEVAKSRLSLFFERDRKKIKALYEDDRKHYSL